jgi:hypothetical protein
MRFLIPSILLLSTTILADTPAQSILSAAGSAYDTVASSLAAESAADSICLSPADAEIVSRSFGLLISNYTTKLAVQLLADDFIDQADSVNQLINTSPLPHQPVGGPSNGLDFTVYAMFLHSVAIYP